MSNLKLTLTHNGRTLSLYEWSRETGIGYRVLKRRLKNGWPAEKVLTVPPSQYRKLTYLGKSQTISEWAKELGIPRRTITTRLFNKASDSDALQPVVRTGRPRKTLTLNGVTKEIHEWAIVLGISPGTIEHRIQSGASVEEVLRPHSGIE